MTSNFRFPSLACRVALAVCLLVPVSLAWPVSAGDKGSEQDLKKLQGTWVVVQAERDGESLDAIKGNRLIVKESQFTVVTKTAELKGNLALNAAKTPGHIDWHHQEGQLRDKKWEGIYKLEGDKLTLSYTEADSGKDRPDEFATRNGTSRLLIVLERKKN